MELIEEVLICNRNNNLGMWTTTGSEGSGGLDSYNDYTDEMSGTGSTNRLSFSIIVIAFMFNLISYSFMLL